MMRAVYRGFLALHPVLFKEQFAAEMLWIFDSSRPAESGTVLLLDCFISLCRQWVFRSGLWKFGVGLLVNLILGHRLILYCLGIGN